MIKVITRAASWMLLGAITVLSLVPPGVRPVTGASHNLEHFGIFLITGAAFAIAYQIRMGQFLLLATGYCAALELVQNFSPGRHARFSDFVVDSAAACAGIALVRLFKPIQP